MSELVKTDKRANKPSAQPPKKRGPKPKKQPKALSAEVRERLIAEAAYYKAESRGFAGGDAERDWLEAESEIDALLLSGKIR
jgi:hypothetical protein